MSDNSLTSVSNSITQFQEHVRKNLRFYVPLAAGTLGLAFLYYYNTSSRQTLDVEDSDVTSEVSLTEQEAMALTKEEIEKLPTSRREFISKLLKNYGNDNFRTKHFQAAIENYSKAIELHEDPVYYCNRAAGYSALKQHQKVIDDCSKTLTMHPEYTKAIVRRAQAYEATSQYQLALNDYVCGFFLAESNHQTASLGTERTLKILAAEQSAAETLPTQLELISVSYALHYVNCFEKVALPSDESDDSDADKQVREAIKLIDSNQFSEAHNLLKSAVQGNTKFMVEALNLRCMFDIIVKDWDSANEGLKQALKINPEHVQCRIKQSNILTETGDVSGAFESLKELQTQHPESYEVHFHLAQIYFILEQVDMAQNCYQKAMEFCPTFEQAHIQYGVSLCYFRPREEAAAFFKKSLDTFKKSSVMLNVYAEFLMECEQLDEVMDILDKALAISPNNATVLLNKSIFYLKAYVDLELAAKYCQQAIDIDPAFTTAILNLANIKSIQTKFDEADELLERSKKTIRSKLELEAIISQQLHNKAKKVFAEQYPKKVELLSTFPSNA